MVLGSAKDRGCFQCTKRRIICDGAHPTCFKCQKKRIECSGLGRFRFSPGVATRGKLKGCAIPGPDGSQQLPSGNALPQKIRWKDDRPKRCKQKAEKRAPPDHIQTKTRQANDPRYSPHSRIQDALSDETPSGSSRCSQDDAVQLVQRSTDSVDDNRVHKDRSQWGLRPTTGSFITPSITSLSPEDRMYLSHFASDVAPVMVIFDHIANGYRDILLPLACEDEVLRGAIRVVAAQHLALREESFRPVAEVGRAAIISRLRRDSLQASPDRIFNLSTWATLIVLLVGETITGSSEYIHLLRTLLSVAPSLSHMTPTPAYQFLVQQTHMYQFLGQPLLGESQGMNALGFHVEHYLDWTYYPLPPDSEYNRVLCVVRQAFIEASQIYILRATTDGDQWGRLERLKQLVSRVGPSEPGAHALVWVCFMAAADSTDPEHRSYFTERMNLVFAQTGFQNIAAAVRSLPNIWAHHSSGRWTSNLIRLTPTLVM